MDDRAATTYRYLTEAGNVEKRDAGEGTVRGSRTLGATDHRGRGQEDWSTRTRSDPRSAKGTGAVIEEFGYGGSRVVLKADQEVASADVQGQVVAASSGETVPANSPVGESLSNGRAENAGQSVQCLIRTLTDALESRMNTRTRSSDPVFERTVE